MKITTTAISERQCSHFLYIQNSKKSETFLYTKSQTLFKKQDNFSYFFRYKKHDTGRYAILHEFFEVGIYIQKA